MAGRTCARQVSARASTLSGLLDVSVVYYRIKAASAPPSPRDNVACHFIWGNMRLRVQEKPVSRNVSSCCNLTWSSCFIRHRQQNSLAWFRFFAEKNSTFAKFEKSLLRLLRPSIYFMCSIFFLETYGGIFGRFNFLPTVLRADEPYLSCFSV